MFIVIGILVFGLFIGIALLLASGVLAAASWAKKQARAMLDAKSFDVERATKVLKILSNTQDDREATRLYDKLAELVESKQSRARSSVG